MVLVAEASQSSSGSRTTNEHLICHQDLSVLRKKAILEEAAENLRLGW